MIIVNVTVVMDLKLFQSNLLILKCFLIVKLLL